MTHPETQFFSIPLQTVSSHVGVECTEYAKTVPLWQDSRVKDSQIPFIICLGGGSGASHDRCIIIIYRSTQKLICVVLVRPWCLVNLKQKSTWELNYCLSLVIVAIIIQNYLIWSTMIEYLITQYYSRAINKWERIFNLVAVTHWFTTNPLLK